VVGTYNVWLVRSKSVKKRTWSRSVAVVCFPAPWTWLSGDSRAQTHAVWFLDDRRRPSQSGPGKIWSMHFRRYARHSTCARYRWSLTRSDHKGSSLFCLPDRFAGPRLRPAPGKAHSPAVSPIPNFCSIGVIVGWASCYCTTSAWRRSKAATDPLQSHPWWPFDS